MKLIELSIKGFKCFNDSGKIPIHSLTVFIGENDAGKSSILEAMDILLNNKNVKLEDYHRDISGNIPSSLIEILGVFEVSQEEEVNEYLLGNNLYLLKRISVEEGIKYFIKKDIYIDERLNNLDKQLLPALKEISAQFGLDASGQKALLFEGIMNYLKQNPQPTKIDEVMIQWKAIADLVPIFQRFTSSDYGNPHNLVAKVLSNVYRKFFYDYDENTKEERLKTSFESLKTEIETSLDMKIQDSLRDVIKKYNPNVTDVKGRYNIDFSKGLDFYQLEIDTGSGLKPIGSRGEGAKKRLYLAILEWDKSIESEFILQRGMIKAYDEPDANLHFSAQRKLFYTIQNEISQQSNIQNVVCTHSLAMIDRAPALSINYLVANENEQSTIAYLETDGDEEIRDFLSQISEIGGIKNSSIFYERCFLLVEGASEENALPVLYKKVFGRNLMEDGIALINLESNGAWKNFLKLLSKNKEKSTLLFLDADTQFATSSSNIDIAKLQDIGFSDEFLTNNVFFVGTKEFEDIYPDVILANMLEAKFPKRDGSSWSVSEIQEIKNNSSKFSDELNLEVWKKHGKRIGKPGIALEFAKFIPKSEIDSLADVKALLEKLSQIIS